VRHASQELDVDAGGTVQIATFPRSSFPVAIALFGGLSDEAQDVVGASSVDFH